MSQAFVTVTDVRSQTWSRLEKHWRARLADLRESNDQLAADPVKTAVIRGRIAEVKEMLDLAKDLTSSSDASNPDEFGVGAAG